MNLFEIQQRLRASAQAGDAAARARATERESRMLLRDAEQRRTAGARAQEFHEQQREGYVQRLRDAARR